MDEKYKVLLKQKQNIFVQAMCKVNDYTGQKHGHFKGQQKKKIRLAKKDYNKKLDQKILVQNMHNESLIDKYLAQTRAAEKQILGWLKLGKKTRRDQR